MMFVVVLLRLFLELLMKPCDTAKSFDTRGLTLRRPRKHLRRLRRPDIVDGQLNGSQRKVAREKERPEDRG